MVKRILTIVAAAVAGTAVYGQNAEWIFTSEVKDTVEKQWTSPSHLIKATTGEAYLTVTTDSDASGRDSLGFRMWKKSPGAYGLVKGDSWEFTMPVTNLPSGSYVELDMSVVSLEGSPRYYTFEYLDGGEWKTMDHDLRHSGDTTYSFRCFGFDPEASYQYTTANQTVRLSEPVTDGEVKVRARVSEDVSCGGGVLGTAKNTRTRLEWSTNVGARMIVLGSDAPKDTTRVLCIGNSFTYVYQAAWMLKELAWSRGHYLEMANSLKGGQTFGQQLTLAITADAIAQGGFQYAFLQNQSQTPAWYWQDRKANVQVLLDAIELADHIRQYSPDARIVMESTWSYPGKECGGFGTLKKFDKCLEKGTKSLAGACRAGISPIGRAFAICRAERPDISLYGPDDKHQSREGAYLKACVNYQVIFGVPIEGAAPSCGLDPSVAAALRLIAAKAF